MTSAPSWADKTVAEAEQKNWNHLDEVRDLNDRRWLTVYGVLLVALTVVFFLLFILSIAFWSWHYLFPEEWGWLSADQLSKIQSVLFSGGLGAIVTSVARKQISKG